MIFESIKSILQELEVPKCFENFTGKKKKNCIQSNTSNYHVGFREKSQKDAATLEIFNQFAAKVSDKKGSGKEHKSYLKMMKDFYSVVRKFDEPFVWGKVSNEKSVESDDEDEFEKNIQKAPEALSQE